MDNFKIDGGISVTKIYKTADKYPIFNANKIKNIPINIPDINNDDVLMYQNGTFVPGTLEFLSGITGLTGPTGYTGPQGLKGDSGIQGIKGDKGDTGYTGPQGIKGDVGDKGDTGYTGPQGLKGDVGDKGDTGYTGPQGLKGDVGDKGDTGYTGPQGLKGDVGDKGDTGYTGPQGLKGDVGDKGDTGYTGPQGIKGDVGDKGDTGYTGPQGLKGDVGDKGDTGYTGPQGIKGDVGDKGDTGYTGPQGLKGDSGIQGIKGDKGDTGYTGPQGLKGDVGDKGDTGYTGPQGLKGDVGDKGDTGYTGPRGEQNMTGIKDKTQTTISFNSTTRQFTMQPVSTSFTVWVNGVEFIKSSSESVTIDNITGLYYIYYNTSGVLSYKTSYFTFQTEAPVAYINYNTSFSSESMFFDERHGIIMDWATHEYLHRTRGAAIANGFSSTYTIGDGSSNSHSQISLSNGVFFDEDLEVSITHSSTPTSNTWQQILNSPAAQLPVVYYNGSGWRKNTATAYPFYNTNGTIYYNQISSNIGSLQTVSNNSYVNYYIIATNMLNSPIISVMGNNTYSNIENAKSESYSSLFLTGFPIVEFRPLYKIVLECRNSFTNSVKTKISYLEDLRVIVANQTYQIGQTVDANNLIGTTIASNVVNSSLTSVGTLTQGTWNATPVGATYGGTGLSTNIVQYGILYATTTQAIGQVATASDSVLITDSTKVPYLSQTLPSGVQTNITKLGLQTQDLNMNSYDIRSTKTVYSDSLKISRYRPTYSIPDLLAIYDFSDPSNLGFDKSGNKRDITVTNIPFYTASLSSIKHSLYFNQTVDNGSYNQYLDFTPILSTLKQNNNVTVSFWLYKTAFVSSNEKLVCMSNNSSLTPSLMLYVNSVGNLTIWIDVDDSTTYAETTVNTLSLSTWTHISFSFGSSGVKLYVNNTQWNTSLISTSIPFSTMNVNTFLFGSSNFSNTISNPLRGSYIHTISFWSTALSTTSITRLYNNNYDYRVVILAGQSNMRGSATADLVDLDNSLITDRVYEFPFSNVNSDGTLIASPTAIAQAQHPLYFNGGRYAGSTSLWKTFCESMLNFIPARTKIILIPAAKSGTGFGDNSTTPADGNQWKPGDPAFKGMVNATNYVLNNYSNSTLSAFLWHQGESDAGRSQYGRWIYDMYTSVTSNTSTYKILGMSSSVPFVMGELYPSSPEKAMINTVLKSYSDEQNGRYLVECSNLNVYDTTTHFDNTSLRQIGYMYADKWIRHYSENYVDRNLYIKSIPNITYSAVNQFTSGSYLQSIYNTAAISFVSTSNATPVYLQVGLTLSPGYWLVNYSLSLGVIPNTTTYCFLSTSNSTETVPATIKANKLTNSQCQAKSTYTAGQDYRNANVSIVVQVATSTSYYLWGLSNTGTLSGYYLFNPSTSGTTPDPDNSIILNAVYLKAL